jgi:hypothetical protein
MVAVGFSPVEEDFFRAGEQLSPEPHDFADLDEGSSQVTFWQSVVGWFRNKRTQHPE